EGTKMTRASKIFVMVITLAALVWTTAAAGQGAPDLRPVMAWRAAVLAGDTAALRKMYANDPRASFQSPTGKSADPAGEIAFWSGWKAKGLADMDLQIAQVEAIP